MATRVSQAEKELMWKLYQKYGVIKVVAEKLNRNSSTVSRYVREYEAAVSATSYVLNVKNI
ncbi:hypothetical protein [Anaerotignum sp.]